DTERWPWSPAPPRRRTIGVPSPLPPGGRARTPDRPTCSARGPDRPPGRRSRPRAPRPRSPGRRGVPVSILAAELKAYGERHPYLHRLLSPSSGIELPRLHRLHRGPIEVVASGGARHGDGADATGLEHLESKQDLSLDTFAARRVRVARPRLV